MATGKYGKVIDTLPPLPAENTQYQERVTHAKMAILQAHPRHGSALAELYAKLRAQKDQIEDVLSECNLQIEAVTQLIVDQYEAEGVQNMKLADTGQVVAVQLEPYSRVEDKDAFRAWCIAEGLEREMVLPWQTANSLAKNRLVEGLPEPDGITLYVKPKMVLRKA